MKLKELKELLDMLKALDGDEAESPTEESPLIGKYVIVRCKDAGVHAGYLLAIKGRAVTLRESRRLWRWKSAGSAHTLSGVAQYGLDAGSKIPRSVELIELLEACEVILTSGEAKESIEGWDEHKVS